MEGIMKTCLGFFTLIVVCHMGKVQSSTTKKKISVEISCKEVNWTEHSHKSCNAVNITVESLDSEVFQFTNLTFAEAIWKFLKPSQFDETCFEMGFRNWQETNMNQMLINISSSNRKANGFIYDVSCSRTEILRYSTKMEDMGPDGCNIKPLGIDDDCRSQNLQVFLEVIATLEYVNDTYFDVPSWIFTGSTSRDDVTDCIITPNDTQFQLHFNKEICKDDIMAIYSPPSRDSNLWNLYAWQNCSKLAFGEQVLRLDRRFDRWVLNNLTSLCGTNLPKMDSCLKEKALSKTPSLEDFNFYSKLRNSYDNICVNQKDFSEGNQCFKSIQSDKAMKAAYVSEAQQCFSKGSSDVCIDYSKNILCMAYAQYKVYSKCTSFQVTYKYKRIIEDRDNARGNCSATQIDPCSTKDPKYIYICSSGHQIQMSFLSLLMLFCLTSWVNSNN